jgi:hypothetical protein
MESHQPKIYKNINNTKNNLLNLVDLLCPHQIGCRDNLQMIKKIEEYVKKKLSVETMIPKFNEIDKLKFTLLSPIELEMIDLINYREITLPNVQQRKTKIQKLWDKYEFNNKKEIDPNILSNFQPDIKLTKIGENILSLLE